MNRALIRQNATGALELRCGYDPGLVAALKAIIPPASRRWDGDNKIWLVGQQYAVTLADLCREHLGIEPIVQTGLFPRGGIETRRVKLEYLGAAKDRGS